MGPGKKRADGAAVQRSGDTSMLILPWTKQILCVVWDHLRLLVHVIYYSFLAGEGRVSLLLWCFKILISAMTN